MGFADTILQQQQRTQPQVNSPDTLDAGPGSGVASAALASKIVGAPGNPYVPGPCNDNSQSSPSLTTATLTIPMNGQTNSFNNQLNLPKPCRRLTIASIGDNGADIPAEYRGFAISISPLGSPGVLTGTAYDELGTEPWIPLPNNFSFLEGVTLEFDFPINQIFFHILTAETGGTTLTISVTFILDGVKVTFPPVAGEII